MRRRHTKWKEQFLNLRNVSENKKITQLCHRYNNIPCTFPLVIQVIRILKRLFITKYLVQFNFTYSGMTQHVMRKALQRMIRQEEQLST
jgi:hypothetical protein